MVGKTIYWLYENSPHYHFINSFIRSFVHSYIRALICPSPNRTPSPDDLLSFFLDCLAQIQCRRLCLHALACNSCSVTRRTCPIYKHTHLMKDISPRIPHTEIEFGRVLGPTPLPPLLNSSSFGGSFGDST